ncbi:MAG: hypothetical protein EXS17_06555 [Phycisphaerales bacterium]|nr:hypothetical protein [Phycisphaerales bacterium]
MTPKQTAIHWLSKLADLPLCLGLLFAIVVAGRPAWIGIVHGEAEPWFVLPLILAVILICAFRASAHAEVIAHRLREPFGSLILTLSAVTIEVTLVVGIMLAGKSEDQVARDTMFAVIMMVMNGLIGFALIMGGLRKREQTFNAKSASAFLALITALTLIGLVLPRLTVSRPGGYMSEQMELYVACASLGVYVAFLALQSSSHREFFVQHEADVPADDSAPSVIAPVNSRRAMAESVALLVVALLAVVLLAESLGGLLVNFWSNRHLPNVLEGVVVAFLILLPEGIAAIRAAWRSNLQTTINILHGSALSTIGLTIPAVLFVSLIIDTPVELGLEPAQICLLAGTIVLSMLHLSNGRANLMQGIVHIMFFTMWIALLLD